MFGKSKEYFTKHYRRRIFCSIALCYITFLSAFRDQPRDHIDFDGKDLMMLTNYRPFSPHAEVITPNEIKVQWLPMRPKKGEQIYYQLFNGDDLEYVGQDLFHVAKRLHAGEEYKFQVRVCNSMVSGDCSQLSFPRYQNLYEVGAINASNCSQYFDVPMLKILMLVIVASLIIWFFVRRITATVVEKISSFFEYEVEFMDIIEERIPYFIDETHPTLKNHVTFNGVHINDACVNSSHLHGVLHRTFNEESDDESKIKTLTPPKVTRKKNRKRSKTICQESKEISRDNKEERGCLSDSEIYRMVPRTESETRMTSQPQGCDVANIVVVVDNSNIFIGARESVCNAHAHVKPKQVKFKLQQLMNVIEKGRSVARAFAGGSSPPANGNVWDIYRRHGYTVDVEDRRGKDEQRVDEQLHLTIYKAVVELPPQTLVLATGDGNKGKSKGETSFISCAEKAIEYGWRVELYSWKHSLSAEWNRLKSHHENSLDIVYLDQFVDTLTLVERKNARRKLDDRLH